MITDDVRRGIESRGNPEARAWIEALPAIVERVCVSWSLTAGPVLEGGKGAFVMRVRRGDEGADRTGAVLKVAPPDDGFASQIRTIEAADGCGTPSPHKSHPK
jgi:hypothetical protein